MRPKGRGGVPCELTTCMREKNKPNVSIQGPTNALQFKEREKNYLNLSKSFCREFQITYENDGQYFLDWM